MTEEELARHDSKTLLQLLLSADARCDALTAERDRLREALTRAADSLGWADAHLEDAGVVSAKVRYGEKSARAALEGETP